MNRKSFGTHTVARFCQVTPPTVGRWIESGKLPSFTTGGGHHRIWDSDMVDFLKSHNIPLPSELQSEGRLVILIVDDDITIRRFLTRAFRKWFPEAEIHEAADGFEAGFAIVESMPALVLLDLRLPGIDGLKVCQRVRSDSRMHHIKILAMSGYAVEQSCRKSLEAGANEFLAKPFDTDELWQKLETLKIHKNPINHGN